MRYVLTFTLLLSSCSAPRPTADTSAPIPQATSRLEILPESTKLYFAEINRLTSLASLPELRSVAQGAGDLEIRVWGGFGVAALQGFSIKRQSGAWSAVFLRAIPFQNSGGEYRRRLGAPKSGWEGMWQRLLDEGVLSLPDASEIACDEASHDGRSFVVEISMSQGYRAYHYPNPDLQKCGEARRMLKVNDILYEEFTVS